MLDLLIVSSFELILSQEFFWRHRSSMISMIQRLKEVIEKLSNVGRFNSGGFNRRVIDHTVMVDKYSEVICGIQESN